MIINYLGNLLWNSVFNLRDHGSHLGLAEDSASFLPSFLDVPYGSGDVDGYPWWDPNQEFGQHLINLGGIAATSSSSPAIAAGAVLCGNCSTMITSRRCRIINSNIRRIITVRSMRTKKVKQELKRIWGIIKAITAGNLTRVQHLVCSQRTRSSTGDANHRLADHGLRALTHLIAFLCLGSTHYFRFNRAKLKSLIRPETLHILDISVSHGVQWPTLLEALSCHPGGPPPLVRITVVAATAENKPAREPVITTPERTNYQQLRMRPLYCSNCGDFATGFSRRVEYLWKFLDSTSSAFKGRESEERRVMEGEAAKALTNQGEMNEGKEKWCERMRGVGFVTEVFERMPLTELEHC
ncbi:hypothetical protein F3Y22_tig00112443pilonHSYRG00155 [Hibiscus syriacus]|uniref:Uncharacterized protein n=1 Tax=Hibiscus syriacus TaxID=106335 RepID=A0A6A2XXV0_HIBSY|nr:hypothetical protein F3Y22_tig00112443pilonHSYRG00155 [Hibiscus syriacus]